MSHPRKRSTVRTAALIALTVLAMTAQPADAAGPPGSASPPVASPPVARSAGGPLAGQALWRNPAGHAVQAQQAAQQRGDQRTAAALDRLARQPSATWLTGGGNVFQTAADLTGAAQQAGQLPVLVAYNLPGRDCGLYSRGGAGSTGAYLSWVGSLAAGIGARPAVVVLEPDAVPQTVSGCRGGRSAAQRYAMLNSAVTILKRQPRTRVYVDAGNASWVANHKALAGALRAAGVARADGFALNTSNFESTRASVSYGARVSSQLGGKRFVIDTSRNGAGRPVGRRGHARWCNPPGARLGAPPSTSPGIARVDALLWIKQPGDSDGECGSGHLPAGQFGSRYAGGLLGTRLSG